MKKNTIYFVVIISCSSVSGCSSTLKSPCDFSISADEWEIVEAGSNHKINAIRSRAEKWYKNKSGDYLVCFNSKKDYVCGGTYETFDVQEGGEYAYDHVVCTN